MKLFVAMIRYEVMLQTRSARFRIAAAFYLALCATPPLATYFFLRHLSRETLGGASYLAQTLEMQPFLTTLLVLLVAGNRTGAGASRETWPVLAAAPISNAGLLLRRWLALLILLIPLSIVPQAITLATALAAGVESVDPAVWIGSWCLLVLPLVVLLSAFWLAWVTVTGGELAALVASLFALPLLVSAVNQALLRFHLTFSGYQEWLGYRKFVYWVYWTVWSWGKANVNQLHPGFAATEGAFDFPAAAAWTLPRLALLAGAAAFGLGLAAAFLRRTRRDLPPRPVPPKHQLRTFLEKLNRVREDHAPDGGLGWRERLLMAAGVAAFAASGLWLVDRQVRFRGLAEERYRAEMEHDFAPLPRSVRPTSWSLKGSVERDGAVEVEVAASFENRGSAPLGSLAFALNPHLEVDRLEVPSRRVAPQRSWDRLLLRLDPPLAPDEDLDLRLRVRGVPAATRFAFGRMRAGFPFPHNYEAMLSARFPRDVPDLSRSELHRAVSDRRIQLSATDLGPLPRYTRWTLTLPDDPEDLESSGFGRDVPFEVERTVVDLDVDLDAPRGWFLADTCGHASRPDRGRSRLRGRCRTSLTELLVVGGSMVEVDDAEADLTGRVTFAALPGHREQARGPLQSLARVASLSDRAWPGMPGLSNVVAVEWPPPFRLDLRYGMSPWREQPPQLSGKLLLIPERLIIDPTGLEPEDLVAQLLARDLFERREIAAEQQQLFGHIYRSLMIRRMGLDEGRGAAVSGPPWLRQGLRRPILKTKASGFGAIWYRRLPAVLTDVESRVGSDGFYTGLDSFLSSPNGEPGTVEELFAELESRSGVSLARLYEDHFLGSALPELKLEDTRALRRQGGWRVEGRVRNTGTGEAVCPVIVKTELSEIKLTVTVGSESASAFATDTAARPHTVVLDPERTCYRFVTNPVLERANVLE